MKIGYVLFHIALERTSLNIWEYDFQTKKINQSIHGFDPIISNAPESLIENGYLHLESVKEFGNMYAKLFERQKMLREFLSLWIPKERGISMNIYVIQLY